MSKQKWRTDTRDSVPKPPKAKPQDKPGTIGRGKLAVYDAGPKGDGKGRRHRGTVGPKATAATASRFNGRHGSKLGTGPDGKTPAWLAPTLAEISAPGRTDAKLTAQRRQARGSATSHPTKPETTARPKRGG
jgi:hypothetical protein